MKELKIAKIESWREKCAIKRAERKIELEEWIKKRYECKPDCLVKVCVFGNDLDYDWSARIGGGGKNGASSVLYINSNPPMSWKKYWK